MSNFTENRIVRMVFDNATFKRAAAETKGALDHVNAAVTNAGKNSGLLNIGKDMDKVAVQAGKMQVAVLTAVGTVANKVTNTALGALNSLTLGPLKQGFNEYEELLTKQNVIMNATGKSAKTVKKVLSELNEYSDQTIYSFGDMTGAITKFVNAGVSLPKSVQSIKGIANAAAFAGASSEEASRAMYAFSQSMGLGFVGLQDWMQIENANMGTVQFKNEIIKAAEAVGTLTKKGDHWVTKKGTFVSATKGWRDSLQEQWATTESLNKALGKYADKSTALGKKAFLAATQVRTFTAFMGTLKESIGSGWGQVFTAMIGGLEESTTMWTNLSTAVGGVVSGFFGFLTTTLTVWRQMGGFTKTMQGFKNLLSPIGALLKAVGDAWRAAFPESGKGAGAGLYGLSYAFELLTRPLTWLAKLIGLLVHPLTLFFMIIKGGVAVVKSILVYIGDFAKAIWDVATFKVPSTGGFWDFVQDVGRWARDAAEDVQRLFDKVESLVNKVKQIDISMPKFKLPSLDKVGLPDFHLPSIFGGKDEKEVTGPFVAVNAKMLELTSSVKEFGTTSKTAWSDARDLYESQKDETFSAANIKELTGSLDGYTEIVAKAEEKGRSFWEILKGIGAAIASFFGNIEGKDITTSLNFAVLTTMGVVFAKMMWSLYKMFTNFGNIGASVAGALDGVGEALGSFQTMAKAKLILNIAIALAILAGALWVLSTIPEAKLKTAFKGLAGVIVAFSVILLMFTKTLKGLGPGAVTQMYALGFAIAAIGVGLLLMSTAMLIMKKVGTKDLIKGLATLAVVFAGLNVLGKMASTGAKNIMAAGFAMIAVGIALGILATSLLIFKLINVSDLLKAGVALLAMSAALLVLSFVPPGMLLHVGAAMLALAISMGILAVALIIFSKVKWSSIAKAAVVLALLTAAVIAIAIFGGGPVGASAIIALAAGVMILSMAMFVFNKVSWNAVAKGAVTLVILVAAFALLMAVVYLAAPVIPLLTGLGFGLGALAFGVALLVTALAIALPLLAASVGAFAIFAAGAAVAITTFLQTLAAEAPLIKEAAIKIFQEFCDGIVESVPIILDTIKRVLQEIWNFFAGPPASEPGKKGGDSIMRSLQIKLQEWTPKILAAIEKLIGQLVQKFHDNADNYAAAAVGIVIALIDGLADKAPDLVASGANLIIKLLEGIGEQVDPVIQAGLQLIVDLFNGIASGIRAKGSEIGIAIGNAAAAMGEAGEDIVAGLSKGIGHAFGSAVRSPWTVLKNGLDGLKDGVTGKDGIDSNSPSKVYMKIGKFLVQGLTVGIQSEASHAITAVASLVTGQIAMANSYISKFVQKLDQRAIAAQAQAEGLTAAAERASEAAGKTEKNKKDDAAAEKLKDQAEEASQKADKAQTKADKAREEADRKDQYKQASTLEKAKMRSEDAQRQIDEAKEAEAAAAKDLAQARALEKAAKSGTYSATESKKMRKEADDLRESAEKQAKIANDLLKDAKSSAADALSLQKKAGAEAAAEFQKRFDDEAKADAKADAFEKLSDAQKAESRRKSAANLEEWSKKNLTKAKKLAYTDLEAANALAQKAIDQAEQARDYINEAEDYEKAVADAKKQADADAAEKAKQDAQTALDNAPKPVGPVLDLTASDAAAVAFNNYAELYSAGTAAAAESRNIEFNQYNTSPEALSPTEVYRQTNNLLTQASDKLVNVAA